MLANGLQKHVFSHQKPKNFLKSIFLTAHILLNTFMCQWSLINTSAVLLEKYLTLKGFVC